MTFPVHLLIDITDLSSKNPFYSVKQESPLSEVLSILTLSDGIHRVNVLDATGKVVGVFSQTDIIRFVDKNKGLFAKVMSQTLAQLKLGTGPIVSINCTLNSFNV